MSNKETLVINWSGQAVQTTHSLITNTKYRVIVVGKNCQQATFYLDEYGGLFADKETAEKITNNPAHPEKYFTHRALKNLAEQAKRTLANKS